MIAKSKSSTHDGISGRAGDAAERQMAFYLDRDFGKITNVHLFHDLRLEHEGEVAQIDHLVMHPFGLVIVESKSVSGKVIVNKHGEWIRCWGGKQKGMPSPIQQARRQGDLLLQLVDAHCEALLDKLAGLVQSRFMGCPLEVIVAISDEGIIERRGVDPQELQKADQVCDRIRGIVRRHRKSRRRLAIGDPDYGVYRINEREMSRIVAFLLDRHTPLSPEHSIDSQTQSPSVPQSAAQVGVALAPTAGSDSIDTASPPGTDTRPVVHSACKHCSGESLFVTHGRYGYYFKCRDCAKNTPIDYACTACGKKGRISKAGDRFHRVCSGCGRQELVWTNAATPRS